MRIDRLIARLATQILVDSNSQADFLVEQRVVPRAKATVLASGSICGVDTQRFRPNPELRWRIRADIDIDEHAVVLLYVGRMNVDKGVLELANAMTKLRTESPVFLLLVGDDEECLIPQVEAELANSNVRMRYIGPSPNPEHYMAASDIYCMPSHREGFGLSVIEASAAGLACVASDIYGLRDAVVDGETGLLFPVGDSASLAAILDSLIDDGALRVQLGAAGRQRATREFEQRLLTQALHSLYQRIAVML